MHFRNNTVNGEALASVDIDPLDPEWVNVNINFDDDAAYKRLKRRLSVQKDMALIVQARNKAAAFAKMEEAEVEIIR